MTDFSRDFSPGVYSEDLDDWDDDLEDSWMHQQEDHPWDDEIRHEQREITHEIREEKLSNKDRWLDA